MAPTRAPYGAAPTRANGDEFDDANGRRATRDDGDGDGDARARGGRDRGAWISIVDRLARGDVRRGRGVRRGIGPRAMGVGLGHSAGARGEGRRDVYRGRGMRQTTRGVLGERWGDRERAHREA